MFDGRCCITYVGLNSALSFIVWPRRMEKTAPRRAPSALKGRNRIAGGGAPGTGPHHHPKALKGRHNLAPFPPPRSGPPHPSGRRARRRVGRSGGSSRRSAVRRVDLALERFLVVRQLALKGRNRIAGGGAPGTGPHHHPKALKGRHNLVPFPPPRFGPPHPSGRRARRRVGRSGGPSRRSGAGAIPCRAAPWHGPTTCAARASARPTRPSWHVERGLACPKDRSVERGTPQGIVRRTAGTFRPSSPAHAIRQ